MSEIFIEIENVPRGWDLVTIKEFADVIMGQSPPSSAYNEDKIGLPFFQGKAEFTELHPIVQKWCNPPNKIALPNDILMSVRAPVGSTNIANVKCSIGRGLAAIRYPYCYKFLFYYFRLIAEKLDKKGTGTTFRAISGDIIKNAKIYIPPLPEQECIVARIEELLGSLNKGIESLKLAQQQFVIYRQAVLGKAFVGAFTKKWRATNPNESASSEFALKKAQREKDYKIKLDEWEIACEKAKREKKSNPPKPKKPYSGAEITAEEKEKYNEVPASWTLVRFIDLIKYDADAIKRGPFGSAIKKAFFVPTGYKVYEQQHAIADDASLGKYYINDEKYKELIGFNVKPGDYLVSCSGTIGKICKLPENCEPGVINQALMKIRLDEELMSSNYFLNLFRAEVFQRRILTGTRGTGMQNLAGIDEIKQLVIPLPPKKEQEAIIIEIETRLSICNKIEESINQSLLQAEALRQSILKKAFEGTLVPQDPNDEPASVLLERIKAEREKKNPVKKVKEKTAIQTKS